MADATTEHMSYIGVKPGCGCVVAAVVDDPRHAAQTRKDVSEFMRWGLTIERVTTEDVRRRFRKCTHGNRPAKQPALGGL
jgi:hypothetical protein